ncbi:glycosyltransferase [Vibrio fluvialis]|uniref:glycosyltransferase n=2 Tax=Vibrio fluvialis TaxID=676 RepID=UPI001EEC65E2|nr:glycosyltransferase [Vibrio fluvialis]ELO1774988.1 glycosyltransferase [Vibrio fluvialis]MCG6410317.1 glycosyltransferase [Vibrio fluvialis]
MSISVSVVVPVYAGEKYLASLVNEVEKVRQSWMTEDYPCYISELIFVDDDSKDGSREVLKTFEHLEWVHLITLARNYGQHPATAAGISYSSGDWIVTLDEDLQHHPKHIIDMLKIAVNESADVVYTNSTEAVHQSPYRDLSSKYYKKMMMYLTKNKHISSFNSFRLIRGNVGRSAAAVCSHDGYLDIVLSWFTNKVSVHKTAMVDQRYVETGSSGYNLSRLISHARRLIMTSDAKLLRVAAIFGLVMLAVSVAMAFYILLSKAFYPESIGVTGWTSQIVTTLFIGSGLAITLSVIAEYLAVVVQHIHGKPTYSVVDRSKDEIVREFFKES